MPSTSEHVDPGAGYEAIGTADVEIVTWVLEGVLAHEDSTGHARTGPAGNGSARSARGTGVEHAERNASDRRAPALRADDGRALDEELADPDPPPPAYRRWDLQDARGYLLDVLRLRDGVTLHVALLDAGDVVALPEDGLLHLQVTRGSVEVAGTRLEAGDAVRVSGHGPVTVTALTSSEILAWHFAAPVPAPTQERP